MGLAKLFNGPSLLRFFLWQNGRNKTPFSPSVAGGKLERGEKLNLSPTSKLANWIYQLRPVSFSTLLCLVSFSSHWFYMLNQLSAIFSELNYLEHYQSSEDG